MIEIRPCADEADEEASLAIYNVVWPWDAVTMDEVRSFKATAVDYVDFLVPAAGSAAVALTPWWPDIGFLHLTVLPEKRRRGVGTSLYRRASAWLARREIELLDAAVPEGDTASIQFAEKRGFRVTQRQGRMILGLAEVAAAPVAPPDGIEIVTWADRPDLVTGMYDVSCEARPDIPGEEDAKIEPFEDRLAHDMQGSGDRRDATFVALAGEQVVGYAKFSFTAAQPKTAHHDLTAVKRAWRRRGIAGALKRAQIGWAKEHDYELLVTSPELRNEPSRRMNERLGYKPAPGRVIMRGPLAPP